MNKDTSLKDIRPVLFFVGLGVFKKNQRRGS